MARISSALQRASRLRGSYVAIIWAVSKVLLVGLWIAIQGGVQADVWYYWRKLDMMRYLGPAGTMTEYPTPCLLLLSIPLVFAFGYPTVYTWGFTAMMLALDGVFAWTLWQSSPVRGRSRDALPTLYWIGFTALIGSITAMRFDVVPAVLAGGALLLLRHKRPGIAGILIALGACIKLWPALLLVALLGRKENRVRAVVGFAATGVAVALQSWWWAGWDRLVSPLAWQRERGLQIESFWATWPMLERSFGVDHPVYVSTYQAFEIFRGVGGWLQAANISTYVGAVAIVGLAVWWLLSPARRDLGVAGLLMYFVTLVMIITNKTFSPQYVIWLGGPLAAVLTLPRRDSLLPRRPLARLVAGTAALAAVTQIIYPLGYTSLTILNFGTRPMTFLLAARNVFMAVLLVWVTLLIVGAIRRPRAENVD